MKTWSLIFTLAASLAATAALAQSAEYDDMYFNSKDRQKLKAEQATVSPTASGRHKGKEAAASDIYADNSAAMANYSARNQNPEFAARSNAQTASDEGEYFDAGYKYNNASSVNSWNNNYNSWYNNPWVANNYWGSSIYGWNSPYYGSYYDSWGNPWMNPYYRSGWSTSYSFYMGNSWGYGSNMGMGLGMSFGNMYANNMWGGGGLGFGYGMSYGYGGGWYGGYPSNVIIYNDYGRNYAYGKRGSQNGMVTRRQSVAAGNVAPVRNDNLNSNGSRPTYNGTTGGRVATNGAVAPSRGQSQRQDDYYNRNWRTSRQGDAYGGNSGGYSQPSRSSQSGWNNTQQSQWNTGSRSSGGFDNGRSGSFNSGGSGVTRSAAPASSGSNGRTRGRD